MLRRRYLCLVGGCLGTIAGCVSSRNGETPAGSPTDTESPTGLDLREANVIEVQAQQIADGWRFDVTLYHDDDGEEGYANWWQVEQLDGTRLGRRELAHAHGTREFTRSASIQIPAGVTCVVVRGHDQTHGYGGRVILLELDRGSKRAINQGSAPRSFSRSDCP